MMSPSEALKGIDAEPGACSGCLTAPLKPSPLGGWAHQRNSQFADLMNLTIHTFTTPYKENFTVEFQWTEEQVQRALALQGS